MPLGQLMDKAPVFKDLRVIELASVLAGPAVGMFFAELGAEVIKIENKTTSGDVTRSWKLRSEDKETDISAYFSCVNWGKKSIALDLGDADDHQFLMKLVKSSDVVISSYKPGDAEKLGVDYESLKQLKPDIICGAINGFGSSDPRPAFDVILQAEAGFMYMNGEPGSVPTKMPVALVDVLAAHQLKQGLLLALYQRLQTGGGKRIDVSLFDSALTSLTNQATNWLVANHIPEKMGSEHPNIVPYGTLLSTSDGKHLLIACGTNAQFKACCKVLNLPSLPADIRFKSNPDRVTNRKELNQLLSDASTSFSAEDLMTTFTRNRVPVGMIRNMQEVFENELVSRMILDDTEFGIRGLRQAAFSFEQNLPLTRPPHYNEHGEEIRSQFHSTKLKEEEA